MSIRNSLVLVALPMAFAGACADDPKPPVAVIASGDSTMASADAGTCTPTEAVSTEVGQSPAIHAGCSVEKRSRGLTYAWTLLDHPAGSTAAIVDPTLITPTLLPDLPGIYRMSLVVTEGSVESDPVVVSVTATACGSQAPAIQGLMASANSVHPGTGVSLTVAASDADATTPCTVGDTLTYAWEWVSVPAGSAATLNGVTGTQAAFVADVQGSYVARVTVTDAAGHATSDTVTVTADACGLGTPTAIANKLNPGGTAVCGMGTINVSLGGVTNEIQLDGSSSTDPDNTGACGAPQNLFYQWTLMQEPVFTNGNNSGATLRTVDGSSTILRARLNGEHRVRLIVTDSTGRRSQETVCVLNVTNVP